MTSAQAIASSLVSMSETGFPLYALIDPLAGEPLPIAYDDLAQSHSLQAARMVAWQRSTHIIELPASVKLPKHLHPYLVALDGPDDPTLTTTVEWAEDEFAQATEGGLSANGGGPHRVGGWIQSSMNPQDLSAHLSLMMRVSTDAITDARYQRLADRRALDWLRQVIGDQRLTGMMGRVQCWHYLTPCGELSSLQSTSEIPTQIRLNSKEWQAFMRGPLLHSVVARWLSVAQEDEKLPVLKQRFNGSSLYQRADTALDLTSQAVKRWPDRFRSPADQTTWALLSMLHHNLAQISAVAALLDSPTEADEPVETIETLVSTLHGIGLNTKS